MNVCVYPDGTVRTYPRSDMSDDYFEIDPSLPDAVILETLLPHFGPTYQLIDVFNSIREEL